MLDPEHIDHLMELLSQHGIVESLTEIPAGPKKNHMILATMQSQEAAARAQQQYGFQSFGYRSLIISDLWIRVNLTEKLEPSSS